MHHASARSYPRTGYLRVIWPTAGAAYHLPWMTQIGRRERGVERMSIERGGCAECGGHLIDSQYDATFRMADRAERLCFGIPGGLCLTCHQLYVDPDLIDALHLRDARCVFAIESDHVLRERALRVAD